MYEIDLATWPRRDMLREFATWEFPHFNLCANVDITAFHAAVKQHGVSFTVATVYTITRAANAIAEFRTRIRGDSVVEHAVIHPSTTILTAGNLFTFCKFTYAEDFATFATQAAARIAYRCDNPTVENDVGRDDLYYTTAIPWISFTSIMHPLKLSTIDSVPRFAWGKFFAAGDTLHMPLSVQGHHALMDGYHAGQFFIAVQELLSKPTFVTGDAPAQNADRLPIQAGRPKPPE